MASRRFLLYSRPGCGLCEEMLLALAAVPEAADIGVDVIDVDREPASARALRPQDPGAAAWR